MFGLGAPPAPKAEEDWSDFDQPAQPAAFAPPPPMPSFGEEELEIAPPAPKAPPAPIELPEEEPGAGPELAPMHAFVPPPEKVGHKPGAPAPAAPPRAPAHAAAEGDGGEALLREALSKASLDVIERVVWEVVPQLAETIIKENLERLVKERQG
jgi:hypothetical protein